MRLSRWRLSRPGRRAISPAVPAGISPACCESARKTLRIFALLALGRTGPQRTARAREGVPKILCAGTAGWQFRPGRHRAVTPTRRAADAPGAPAGRSRCGSFRRSLAAVARTSRGLGTDQRHVQEDGGQQKPLTTKSRIVPMPTSPHRIHSSFPRAFGGKSPRSSRSRI
jgi:hypothetical protein